MNYEWPNEEIYANMKRRKLTNKNEEPSTATDEEIAPMKIYTLSPVCSNFIFIALADISSIRKDDLLHFEDKENHKESEVMLVREVSHLIGISTASRAITINFGYVTVQRNYGTLPESATEQLKVWPANYPFTIIGNSIRELLNPQEATGTRVPE